MLKQGSNAIMRRRGRIYFRGGTSLSNWEAVSELHGLVRAQVRGNGGHVCRTSTDKLSTSQRAALAALKRRLHRSRRRGVVAPNGRDVWGVV